MKRQVLHVYLLAMIGVAPLCTGAQVRFQEYYGVPPYNYEVSHGIAPAYDGGYFVAGETHDNSGLVPWDLYVIRTDSAGSKIWSRRYHNSQNSNHPAGNIIATRDSGFAMAPMTNSGDLRIVRFDKDGNFLWSRQYGAGYGSPRDIIQTLDGGFAVAGDEYYFAPSVFKAYVVKTDAAGNLQWDKALYGTATVRATGLVQNDDSSYVICGIEQAWSSPANILLCQLDKTGVTQWVKSIGTAVTDEAYGIRKTVDGGYIVAGNTNINGTDVMLVRTDASGNVVWAKAYGTASYDGNIISHNIEADADGGFTYFGYTMSGPLGSADLMQFRTDGSGNLAWARTYGSVYSESGYVSGFGTADGGHVLTGRRAGNLNGDLLVVKTDDQGACGCSEAILSLTVTPLTVNSLAVTPAETSGGAASVKDYTAVAIFGDSTIICATAAPLPVQWLGFSAVTGTDRVTLTWTTASEVNNSHFTVTRGTDGQHFAGLGIVAGAGSSSIPVNYTFADLHPVTGLAYYRIEQTDVDGRSSRSAVVAVRFSGEPGAVVIFPTAGRGTFRIHCNGCARQPAPYQVLDVTGREVAGGTVQGEGPSTLTLPEGCAGLFFFRLLTPAGVSVTKFFVDSGR
jgi:hypothetical protein